MHWFEATGRNNYNNKDIIFAQLINRKLSIYKHSKKDQFRSSSAFERYILDANTISNEEFLKMTLTILTIALAALAECKLRAH